MQMAAKYEEEQIGNRFVRVRAEGLGQVVPEQNWHVPSIRKCLPPVVLQKVQEGHTANRNA
eukprot:1160071-Pelagomonas_calceolata.AAC.13